MKRTISLPGILLIILLIAGCDSNQYQIVTGSDGALYRFNRKTGALSMVMGDKKIVRLSESQKSEIMKEDDSSSLEKPVDWTESKYPGKNLKAKLETVWRENKLCYKISVCPYKSLEKIFARKKRDYMYSLMKPGFTMELVDKNGFLVKEIRVNLLSMTKVEDSGELVLNSQIDCTRQSYRSIGGCVVKWALDSDMIGDDEDNYIKSPPIRSER